MIVTETEKQTLSDRMGVGGGVADGGGGASTTAGGGEGSGGVSGLFT